jgi:hypothetical protein
MEGKLVVKVSPRLRRRPSPKRNRMNGWLAFNGERRRNKRNP